MCLERDPSDPPAPDERPEDTGMTKDDYLDLMIRGVIDPEDPQR